MNGILIENKTATIPLTRIAVAHFWKTGDFIDAVCIITIRSIEFGVCSNYQLRTTNYYPHPLLSSSPFPHTPLLLPEPRGASPHLFRYTRQTQCLQNLLS